MAELTQEQISQLVQQYIRETLDNDEKCRAISGPTTDGSTTLEGLTFLESSDMKADEAQSILTSVNRWLKYQKHSLMEPVAEKLIKTQGKEIAPESASYKTLKRELMKAFQGVLHVRIKRSEGNYSVPDEDLIPMLKQQPQVTLRPHKAEPEEYPSVKFSEVQEDYLVEVAKGENWTAKTKAENVSIFALFVRVVGDLTLDKINRKLLSEYKTTLMKLPPNLNKLPQYRDKSIEDVIALKPVKTLTVNSVNKYIRRMSGLFNYAVKNGYMLTNPAEGLQIKRQRRADQERESYSTDDLKKLFGSQEYTEGRHRQSYGLWAPLIALYSGCRLEEICQLHLDDIRQEGGVWVFDVNDKEEKRLKNISSERLVPIHPQLIELGLIKHVDKLKTKGESRLFPELRQQRDGYGQTVSKWFQRYKKRCGIAEGKTFHSFRHTFITHLKHKQVDPYMIHEIDGHTIESETMGRYGKRYTPDILLREAIVKIDYGLALN